MLYIKSDSDTTTLAMVQNSINVTVDVPSGYLPQNLDCNPQNAFITVSPEYPTVNVSVNATFGDTLPCDGILFNGNTTSSFLPCTVDYDAIWQYIDSSQFHPMFDCYGNFQIDEIYEATCLTTLAPTEDPTGMPSPAPTAAPSISPSPAPSATPTAPSTSPSKTPSNEPTMEPTSVPSIEPTVEPTNQPSTEPTPAPSTSPTVAPTQSPSPSPSLEPTLEPTVEPTLAPSSDPTAAPSNSPVASNEFDTRIETEYEVEYLSADNMYSICTDTANQTAYMEMAIKSSIYDPRFLTYDEFMVTITMMNNVEITELSESHYVEWTGQTVNADANSDSNLDTDSEDSYVITLNTEIECNEGGSECGWIKAEADGDEFMDKMSESLQSLFNNSNIDFTMSEDAALTVVDKDAIIEDTDWAFIALLSFCGALSMIAPCAFLWNKRKFPRLPGFHPVDEARFPSTALYALQIWDFYSDGLLAFYIVNHEKFLTDILYLVSGIGAMTFTVIPYVTNMVMAARIKKQNINKAAKGWFAAHNAIFAVLTVLSGGCHAALGLVSSNIFGLTILSSGLTKYELKQMAKLKVFGTVVIENLPQLIFQLLLSLAEGTVNENVLLAASASFLSVIATTLSYLIERDERGSKVVQYYISTECLNRGQEQDEDGSDSERNIAVPTATTNTATNVAGEEATDDMKENTGGGVGGVSNGITEMEKFNIIENRGNQESLAHSLAECYCINWENIEIGATTVTTYGATTHIVHYVYDEEIEEFEEAMVASPRLTANAQNFASIQKHYTHHLAMQYQDEVSFAFRKHFQLNSDFVTSYQSGRNRMRSQSDTTMRPKTLEEIRKIRSQDMLNLNTLEEGLLTTAFVKNTVHSWIDREKISLNMDQRERLNSLFGGDTEGKSDGDGGGQLIFDETKTAKKDTPSSPSSEQVILQYEHTSNGNGGNGNNNKSQDHLLNSIEMALQMGNDRGRKSSADLTDHSEVVDVNDDSLLRALDNIDSDFEGSSTAAAM